ncbi:hypothetical protein CDAR_388261 [Caerostris darwini]|uniref:Uncharacterized protein n=1 Tax=Caerostris darwini TaxID=1538125 RepID=A0AAV4WDX7_9ARAC|nr:hypothetical protein CDAR_388261 [Caerostris darwini]
MEADRKIMNSDFGVKEPATKENQHPEKSVPNRTAKFMGKHRNSIRRCKRPGNEIINYGQSLGYLAAAGSTSVCRPHETVPSY